MATRSRSDQKRGDEMFFPVRLRVCVPEEGFGRQLDMMHKWLNENAGRGGWGQNADQVLSREPVHSVSFYFRDISLAATFVEMFGLDLIIGDPDLCGQGSFRYVRPADGYWGNR